MSDDELKVISVNSGITEKNQRPLLPAGTKCASAVVRFEEFGSALMNPSTPRHRASLLAHSLAVRAWEDLWGKITYHEMIVTEVLTHLTSEVIFEIQVSDD